MNRRMKAQLVNDALLMAVWKRKPAKGLIWHTDRGSQYAPDSHRMILNDHHVTQSMSRKPGTERDRPFLGIGKYPLIDCFVTHPHFRAAVLSYQPSSDQFWRQTVLDIFDHSIIQWLI